MRIINNKMNRKEIMTVKKLGEEIGYGHLMTLASALWRRDLKEKGYPVIGAFVGRIGKLDADDKNYDNWIKKLVI